jgi:hypothetical protein
MPVTNEEEEGKEVSKNGLRKQGRCRKMIEENEEGMNRW